MTVRDLRLELEKMDQDKPLQFVIQGDDSDGSVRHEAAVWGDEIMVVIELVDPLHGP